MKTINLLLPALLISFFLAPANAQTTANHGCCTLQTVKNLNGAVYHNPNAIIDRYLRTTAATGSRITGETDLDNHGASFYYYDSIILTYTGTRGGDLNHLGTQLKFDNAYVYYYNTTTSAWENGNFETQTFDASDEVQTTVVEAWDAATGAWVNSGQNLYTWAGGNLQSYVNQTWDTVGSAWVDANKYLFTYDGAGNMLTETDQVWNTSTSAWVNQYQYTYTFNVNNKVTSEIDQNWDVPSSSWINQNKLMYTYDGTNTYVMSRVSQSWNTGTSAWDNYSNDIYTYDGLNDRLTDLYQNWMGSAWVNSDLATYSSFVAQLPQTEIDQVWNTTTLSFDNSTKYTYTYNSFNQETSSMSQAWNIGGFWQPTTTDRESRFYYQSYATGVNILAANTEGVILYPVPATDNLIISLRWSEIQPFTATVYNITGAVVSQWQVPACDNYNTSIPLDLQAGCYFIKFDGAYSNMVRQFVVVK